MKMFLPVTKFLPSILLKRSRLLPSPGRVVARKGQKVNANDIIAEANLTPQHLMLDLSKGLGIPVKKLDKYLERHVGDRVSEGDVIAGPVGLTHRIVRAPAPGQVVLINSGQVLLELDSPPFELRAGLPGVVAELIPERGALIESSGTLIQGIWGNGQINSGLVRSLLDRPENVLTSDRMDVSFRGAVVISGYCEDEAVLEHAADLPLRGLVLSSLASKLVPLAAELQFPVLVVEGFGLLPWNSVAFNLLSGLDQTEVAINAETWDPVNNQRPELLILEPSTSSATEPEGWTELTVGQHVRVIASSNHGRVGIVSQAYPRLETFPSGMKAQSVKVSFENGNTAMVPVANLEALD
jgi:hypothetical protein